MLNSLVGTELDDKAQAHDHIPAFKVMWFSRWQDNDSDIVRGTYKQTPVNITDYVLTGSLNLDSKSDASSASLTIALKKLSLGMFYNCIIKIYEGDSRVDEDDWPNTFTGWHVGQPGATEGLQDKVINIEESQTERGTLPTVNLSFVSREAQFTEREITSDGSWYPNVKNNDDPNFTYRDSYDDIGSIARELATNTEWGMGLENDEVLIGPLPYRIEKQLQFVQVNPFEALKTLGEVLHLAPQFNGEGKLRFVSRRIDGTVSRSYSGLQIANAAMSATAFNTVNCITAVGLDKEISKVIKPFQKMATGNGTCGFFDPSVEFEDTWSDDNQRSYLVLTGTNVEDGNGNVIPESPAIRNMRREFRVFGGGSTFFIEDPEFLSYDQYGYKITVRNNTDLVYVTLVALFLTYTINIGIASYIKQQASAHVHPPGAPSPDNITATAQAMVYDLLASTALLAAIWLLQQVGNFSFDIWAIPYEPVYKELKTEVVLEHFGSKFAGQPFRQYERREVEIKNYIFSSKDDSVVAAGPNAGQPEVTNPGLLTFAERELSIRMSEQIVRSIQLKRDILLEPGDLFLDEDTGFKYKVKAINREIGRGIAPMMSANVFRIA